jgi:NAD(P)H-flavin reductase
MGRNVLIVGGGVGLAPLRSLLYALFGEIEGLKSIVIRYGARTPDDIVYKRLVGGWGEKEKVDMKITVDRGDDGWKGNVGVVTTILDAREINIEDTSCVVCGPPIMMKFAVAKLLEIGFPPPDIYLSMEKNMSCGLGKCGHCRLGPYYVCKDGPVFTYEQIKDLHDIWD